MMEMVVNGASTRKVEHITRELCGEEFSKSTVSELCKGLDPLITAWNNRPLSETEYRTKLRTTNSMERLNDEIHQREQVILIFPNRESSLRLLGAFLIEYDEKGSERNTLI